MRRLYIQIYLAFVGIVVMFGILGSLLFLHRRGDPEEQRMLDGIASVVSELLPAADRPREELQRELGSLGERLGASFAVAHLCGVLAHHLSGHPGTGRAAALGYLEGIARYHGPERRGAAAPS